MSEELLKRIPTWLIGVALILLALIVIVQRFVLGQPIYANGIILPSERALPATSAADLPIGAVAAFDLPGGCPEQEGWFEFSQANGRFILGVDGSKYKLPYVGGEPDYQTAGEAEHELDLIEIPRHGHRISTDAYKEGEKDFIHDGLAGGGARIGILSIFKELPNLPSHQRALPDVLEKTGGMADGKAQPHNNMPPYIALYFCKYTG